MRVSLARRGGDSDDGEVRLNRDRRCYGDVGGSSRSGSDSGSEVARERMQDLVSRLEVVRGRER